MKKGVGRRGRVTAAVTLVFEAVALTGVALLGVEGANSEIGLWHYRLGIAGIILFSAHILRRIPALRKAMKPMRTTHGRRRR